ncbi:MAG: carbohydrate kinase [Chitinivibrionales bacterium]|nr:carbohydrate kinase [Chitinivibrionales bacterium]
MAARDFLVGYDIGSSSVKASLLDTQTGNTVATATSPDTELEILAPHPGWAEQDPRTWWDHIVRATARLREAAPKALERTGAIGLSYQMHGLVIVDKNNEPLRNAIIWCDSRAVQIGEKACERIGRDTCLERLLNSPGNFTAAKLAWVKANEPEVYRRIHRMMLPGDYVAMRMTGDTCTTPSGLSEGILWDYGEHGPADIVLDHFGIDPSLIPPVRPTFSAQGALTSGAAQVLGLPAGIPVAYRGGDQPNNAFSLRVLDPGEIAATAGTSGVVYGVTDRPLYDSRSRVNTFVHVNHAESSPRYGMLLCVNGTGILNSWLRRLLGEQAVSYVEMNAIAAQAPVGADGLIVLPYGNGAERTLGNRDTGALVQGLRFTRHSRPHLLRAAQEGIVFALNYGLDIMRASGVAVDTIRAGNANMFLSPLFRQAFATVSGARIELYDTDGAQGAARGAGVGAGIFPSAADAFVGLRAVETIEPDEGEKQAYDEAYAQWSAQLNHTMQGAN